MIIIIMIIIIMIIMILIAIMMVIVIAMIDNMPRPALGGPRVKECAEEHMGI